MRGFARFLVLLVVVVAIAYLGLWWYAEGRLEVGFRQGETALRQAGWTVRHGAVARGSSPAAATLAVADLEMTPPADGTAPRPTITLPNFGLAVRPASPFTLAVGLPLSWHVALSNGPAFTVAFAAISDLYRFDPNALLRHEPNPIRSTSFSATGMRIDSADTNFTLVSIATFTAEGTENPEAGTGATALSLRERMKGLALSPLFVTLGHLPFAGKLAALSLDLDLSGPPIATPNQPMAFPATGFDTVTEAAWHTAGPALHQWAKAGGHGRFALAVDLGPLKARAAGGFAFDAKAQPTMRSKLDADGVGAFLGDIATAYPSTLGIVSTITAATAPYMTKTAGGSQHLAVDFALANGILTANGKKAAHVPPIDWPSDAAAK